MALLEFSGVAFGYSDDRVVVEASGALQAGNVIGLVGANGGGKTTLLKIFLGELAPEEGRVQRSRQTKLAYVAQSDQGDDGQSLYDFVRGGRTDLAALEVEIGRLHHELEENKDNAELLERLGKAEERFTALGGHRHDHETERLLIGLSFSKAEFDKPLGILSGGQRQKGCLARALISDADGYIFDEPTNHLDLDAQAFFVDYLKGLPRESAVLLVSHDRWLLSQIATHIWELDGGILYRYTGGYDSYVPARDLRRKQAREQFLKQQEHIARTEEYIRRNIAGQNTKQAQGRRKILSRMERMDRPSEDPNINFVLQPALKTGEQVLIIENLAFGYGARQDGDAAVRQPQVTHVQPGSSGLDLNPQITTERGAGKSGLVLDDLAFQLYRGERLGIVGPNGCGKTTLLKLLAKQLPPLRGTIAWGSNVELGVFSQDSADLVPGRDLFAEMREVEPGMPDGQVRDYLGRFGFSHDDVFADVATLSGGERSRLSLAKIFRKRPSVLLFDEPTNHLDIYAREAIEQFIHSYQGSVVLVTHDRALLERICNRLVVFRRDDAGVLSAVFFRGGYGEFVSWRRKVEAGEIEIVGQEARPREARREGAAVEFDPAHPELLDIEDVPELAKAARTSPEGFLNKYADRARQKASELESRIAEHEDAISTLKVKQTEADKLKRYDELTRLQQEIDGHKAGIDAVFEELEGVMETIETWEGLIGKLPE